MSLDEKYLSEDDQITSFQNGVKSNVLSLSNLTEKEQYLKTLHQMVKVREIIQEMKITAAGLRNVWMEPSSLTRILEERFSGVENLLNEAEELTKYAVSHVCTRLDETCEREKLASRATSRAASSTSSHTPLTLSSREWPSRPKGSSSESVRSGAVSPRELQRRLEAVRRLVPQQPLRRGVPPRLPDSVTRPAVFLASLLRRQIAESHAHMQELLEQLALDVEMGGGEPPPALSAYRSNAARMNDMQIIAQLTTELTKVIQAVKTATSYI